MSMNIIYLIVSEKKYIAENIAKYLHTSSEPERIAENIEYFKSSVDADFNCCGFEFITIPEVISSPIQRTR